MGSNNTPGPDPSTLDTADQAPPGVNPIPMRITYSSDQVSDFVSTKRSGLTLRLELAPPLLNIVRKAGEVRELVDELKSAFAAISIPILEHFKSTVVEFANHFLHVPAFSETVGLSTAAYILFKLREKGLLVFGHIHQASIEELGSWMRLIENAKEHPDIDVN